jgi:hypothetical protein
MMHFSGIKCPGKIVNISEVIPDLMRRDTRPAYVKLVSTKF